MPELAVDTSGKLAVCYSDRRNDPQNDAIDHYCSVSEDGGGSFQDLRLTEPELRVPAHSTDLVLNKNFMQDYDFVSPDWRQRFSFSRCISIPKLRKPNVYGARF